MFLAWRKFLAAFIVLWALADIAVPGVCQADDLDSPEASAQTAAISAQSQTHPSVGARSVPSQSPATPLSPADCFCCCAHVVPTPAFRVVKSNAVTRLDLFLSLEQPLGQASHVYHPPKA